MRLTERLALYTTVYPGVEEYLFAWYKSVLAQTDCNFDAWIGVDGLNLSAVIAAMGADASARWVIAAKSDSPAQIRQKAIARMIKKYPAVVFVDSDDVLEPTRVEAARESLQENDVSGCAMRIMDEDGYDLGVVFEPPDGVDIATILPRNNVFGLSNTAYRSRTLCRCLPIPPDCVLVDWFLITRAWTLGARVDFDFTCRMAYRQHPRNTARVLPPFTPQQVTLATERVLDHYTFVLENIPELQPQHRAKLEVARDRVKAFHTSIKDSPNTLHQYVRALNKLPSNHIWWACVAHPKLEEVWKN
jgi:hypothetical protein